MVSLWAACPVCSHTQRASLQRRLLHCTTAAQDLAAALPASAAHPRLHQRVSAPLTSVCVQQRDRAHRGLVGSAGFDARLVR